MGTKCLGCTQTHARAESLAESLVIAWVCSLCALYPRKTCCSRCDVSDGLGGDSVHLVLGSLTFVRSRR